MLRASLLLALLGAGCSHSRGRDPTIPRVERDASGLYGRLKAEAGATLSIYRAGMRTPIVTAVLEGDALALPLPSGVYMAILEEGAVSTRRAFAIGSNPVVLLGGIRDPWPGEEPTIGLLVAAQRRWFAEQSDMDPERLKALRAAAHSEVAAWKDPRVLPLGMLAAESVFIDPDTPPAVRVLDVLPAPDDPALVSVHEFPAPVWLAMKFGDNAARARGQAWLDAAARTNPEPGARATALYYALEGVRFSGPKEGVEQRYAWIPELDIDDAGRLEMIDALFSPDRKAQRRAELPAFSLVELDDPTSRVEREALDGELVLLHFWATWCRPCIEQIPDLQRVHELVNVGTRKVHFVSINVDEDPELARRSRRERWPMPWTHLHIGTQNPDDLLADFGLLGPSCLLVDPAGQLLATSEDLDPEHLEQTLLGALLGR